VHKFTGDNKQKIIKHYQKLFELNNHFNFYIMYKNHIPIASATLYSTNRRGLPGTYGYMYKLLIEKGASSGYYVMGDAILKAVTLRDV